MVKWILCIGFIGFIGFLNVAVAIEPEEIEIEPAQHNIIYGDVVDFKTSLKPNCNSGQDGFGDFFFEDPDVGPTAADSNRDTEESNADK